MKLNINPFDAGNPMSLKDAAIVALVVTLASVGLGFFDPWTYEMIAAEPGRFLFELFKDVVKTFAATFIGLAGLQELVKRTEQKET